LQSVSGALGGIPFSVDRTDLYLPAAGVKEVGPSALNVRNAALASDFVTRTEAACAGATTAAPSATTPITTASRFLMYVLPFPVEAVIRPFAGSL
jgi:hypothetical protein